MRQRSVVMVVSAGLAACALSGGQASAQEEAGQYRTAISAVGGVSVGSSGGPRFEFDHGRFGQGGDGAAFAVGGSLSHDVSPRVTIEAGGLYLDRGSSAWSADAGLRLNLRPSGESLVPYFAVSGGVYGEETRQTLVNPMLAGDLRGLAQPFLDRLTKAGHNGMALPALPGPLMDVANAFTTTSSHRTDGMLTMGGGAVFAAGSHVFVRPDARAQVLFGHGSRVLGLFALNFGYRF
jgi:hypothetical protein